jgi:ferredoxin
MTIVVTENCHGCRFTECVTVCPVECFHGDESMLYIDREVCIECVACVSACPVHAIYDVNDLPASLVEWDAINAERAPRLPLVDRKQLPLPTAEARRAALGLAPAQDD